MVQISPDKMADVLIVSHHTPLEVRFSASTGDLPDDIPNVTADPPAWNSFLPYALDICGLTAGELTKKTKRKHMNRSTVITNAGLTSSALVCVCLLCQTSQ